MNSWREDEARKLTDQLLVAVRSQITGRPDECLLQQMLTAIEQLSGLCHGGKEVTEHLRTLHDCAPRDVRPRCAHERFTPCTREWP